jgi:hypothetical protein
MAGPAKQRLKTQAARQARDWRAPGLIAGVGLALVLLSAWWVGESVRDYRDDIALAGKSNDPTPVAFTVAGATLTVPGNTVRFASTRSGGTVARVELLLRWPGLEGFTDANADIFRDSSSLAPLIYVTIAPRETPLDMDDRLSSIYASYFGGDPFAGPSGLTGRNMTADSGYAGEEVYYARTGPVRFAARCMAEASAEVPATCIRDVNIGRNLSMLYRFNRFYLGDWAAMDRELKTAASSFLGE